MFELFKKIFGTVGTTRIEEQQHQKVIEAVVSRNQQRKYYKNFRGWDKLDSFALPNSRRQISKFMAAPKVAKANHLELIMRPSLESFTMDLSSLFPMTKPIISIERRSSTYSVSGGIEVEEIAEFFVRFQRFEEKLSSTGSVHTNGVLFVANYSDRVEYEICPINCVIEKNATLNSLFAAICQAYVAVQYAIVTKPEMYHHLSNVNKKSDATDTDSNRDCHRKVVLAKHTTVDKPTTNEKSGRQIKCEAWGVSGHWRHYSNGKIVWIKPYVKGRARKDPSKYSPKTYTILEEGR